MNIVCPDYEGSGRACIHLMKGKDKGLCTLPGYFECSEWMRRHRPVKQTNFAMSYSRGRSWSKCRKLYHYEYRMRLHLKPEYQSVPLKLGSLASKCLAYIHSESQIGLKTIAENVQDALKTVDDDKTVPFLALQTLMELYSTMEIANIKGECEKEGVWEEEGYYPVHGFLDFAEHGSTEYIWGWEFKYSGRMSNWSKFVLTPQLSTYFLCFPNMPRVTVRVFRNPDLRKGAKEEVGEFIARLRTDIQRRPRYYIEDMIFWREEFDLDYWKNTLRAIHRDILKAEEEGEDSFYQNQTACFSPWQCEFYPICSTDNLIPEDMYEKKPEKREGV